VRHILTQAEQYPWRVAAEGPSLAERFQRAVADPGYPIDDEMRDHIDWLHNLVKQHRQEFGKQASYDEFGEALMRFLREHGGTTFREMPGDGPTSGYMVSQTPDNRHPAETFHPDQVKQYRDEHREHLQGNPDEYVGVWEQPDGVYNEISKNHRDYLDAIGDAYDRDQIALHDLGYGTDIDVAATQYNGQPGIYLARQEG